MKHSFKWMAVMLCLALASTVMASDIVVNHGVDEAMPIVLSSEQGVSAPELLAHSVVHPKRPQLSSNLNQPSKLTLALVVRADGTVGRIEPIAVQHPGMGFEAEAVKALQNWKYKPATKAGQPVNSFDVVTILFPAELKAPERGEIPVDFRDLNNMLTMAVMHGEKPMLGGNTNFPEGAMPASVAGNFLVKANIYVAKEGELYNRNPPDPETGPTDDSNFITVPPNVGIVPGG